MKTKFLKTVFAVAILICGWNAANAQTITISPDKNTFCVGEDAVLTYAGNEFDDDYYWYMLYPVGGGPETYYYGYFYNYGGSYPIPNVPPGLYQFVVLDTNYLFGGPVELEAYGPTINIVAGSSASIIPAGSTTFCTGGSVLLNNDDSSGSYQWFLNGDTLAGDTDYDYVATQPGNYTLQETNVCGNSTAPAITVTVDSTPVAVVTVNGPTTFCEGDSVILSTDVASGYLWSNNATSQNITVTQSGNYSVSVNDGGNCSATSTATTVIVNPAPAANIGPGGTVAFCPGDSVILRANAESSYLWSNSATTQNITVNQAGSFTVNVTDTNGCTTLSEATVITVNSPPTATITAGGNTTFCQGDSVILSANTESSYLWSTNATAETITVSTTGRYTVKVTDTNGCTALSNPESVAVNSLPAATITPGGVTSFCDGDSVALTGNTANSYLWSNNNTTQSITIKQNGSYTLTITDANNCSGVSTAITVTVDTLPAAIITASGDTTFCTGGSVTLTASPATIYLWNTGASTQNINPTQGGDYTVTVTNANNCSAVSNQVHITVNPAPGAIISPASVSFCEGGNATLTASGGISYVWSNGANTDATVVSPDSAITYTVTVTAANNCTAATRSTVTVNPLPSVTISPSGSIAVCEGDSQLLSAPEGNPGYLWSTNATTQTIEATFTGNYLVTVTSINNCSAVSNAVSLTVNPLPPAPTISRSNDTLTSTTANSYQWYLSGSAISNATERTLIITQNGGYTVQVRDSNGCQNTSSVINITALSIENVTTGYTVQLYPNPNNGNFTLQFSDNIPRSVSITDATGRTVIEAQQVAMHKEFDCATFPGGIYLLQIKENTEVKTLRFVITK